VNKTNVQINNIQISLEK